MRKITFLFIVSILSLSTFATEYITETFNYESNSLLKNNLGWASAGVINDWNTEFYISSTSMSYTDAAGTSLLSNTGKSMVCEYTSSYTTNSSNYYVFKNFVSTALTEGVVYASFLYSPNDVAQTQSQIPVISLGTTGSNTGVQVWVGKVATDGTTFRFGVTRGSTSSSSIVWGATTFTDKAATYFIVLKYDISNTTASVFVNPVLASSTEPTALATDNASSSHKTSLQTVQFKVNGASKEYFRIGGIRISSTWAEAVEKKVPSSLSNPTVSNFAKVQNKTIQLSEVGDVVIYNMQGAKMLEARNTNVLNTNLKSGVYMIHFSNAANKKSVQKISIL